MLLTTILTLFNINENTTEDIAAWIATIIVVGILPIACGVMILWKTHRNNTDSTHTPTENQNKTFDEIIQEISSRLTGNIKNDVSAKMVETGILKINDVTIVCSPFELFSSLALILKEKKHVECFGYTNCLEGYLADCDAWDNLDYEALSSEFQRGEGERYIDLVSALV